MRREAEAGGGDADEGRRDRRGGEWGAGRGPGRGGEETVTAAGESVCGVRASPNSSQVTVPGEDTKNHPPCPCSTCQTHRRNDTLRRQVILCGMRAIFPSGQRSALCSCHSGRLGTSAPPQGLPPASPGPTRWSQSSMVVEDSFSLVQPRGWSHWLHAGRLRP